nr:hypothetical protein [Tanacetum cinerariifolium]
MKEDVSNVSVWVKLHWVPVTAFSKDGLSAIATKLGTSLILGSYTSNMCIQSWGRLSYARALIEIRADAELKDTILVVCQNLLGKGSIRVLFVLSMSGNLLGVRIERNKKKDVKPTKEVSNPNPFDVLNLVENDVDLGTNRGTSNLASKKANSSGYSFWNVEYSSTTHVVEKIYKIERLIIDGKVTLVDDEGKPLENVDSSDDHNRLGLIYNGQIRRKKVHKRDFVLEDQAGKSMALVGQSRPGKSFVLSLLLRFYDPTSGRIRIEENNIKQLKLKLLQSYKGLVRLDLLTVKVDEENRSKLLAELIESRRKYFAAKRAKEIRNKPPTKEVIKNGKKVQTKMVGPVEQPYEPTTVEEKLDRKNEIKARGTLLMALPNKDQLKIHSYQDAKLLMEAIVKRYGGNKESKKVQRTLLKQQYENFTASSSETLHQTFDRLQKLISQLEIQGEVIKQEDINLKLSKVECFNSHKNGHFARECRAPKNQENRGREYGRKTMPVENPTENALIAQDGIGGFEHLQYYCDKRVVRLLWNNSRRETNAILLSMKIMMVDLFPLNMVKVEYLEKETNDILLSMKIMMVDLFPLNMVKVEYLEKFYDTKGIKREFGVPRTPQQNGVAERKNRTLIKDAKNMALVIKPHNKIPYELIHGRRPIIDFMKPFGNQDNIVAGEAEKKKEP